MSSKDGTRSKNAITVHHGTSGVFSPPSRPPWYSKPAKGPMCYQTCPRNCAGRDAGKVNEYG